MTPKTKTCKTCGHELEQSYFKKDTDDSCYICLPMTELERRSLLGWSSDGWPQPHEGGIEIVKPEPTLEEPPFDL